MVNTRNCHNFDGHIQQTTIAIIGYKPMSEVFTVANLKRSSRIIEQLSRWLVIILGIGFLVQGLGGTLSRDIVSKISFSLFGLSALMLLAIIGITIANWKAK